MKNVIVSMLICLSSLVIAQEKFNVYNPNADAQKELTEAVSKAHSEGKHVLVQIGGNWCGWCKFFHNLTTTDEDLKELIAKNYEVVHVNYSKENTNTEVLAQLEYPQRFGFPVFLILDGNGKRIHTQNSSYLEEGQGHSKKKVLEFLQQWSADALNPEHYKK